MSRNAVRPSKPLTPRKRGAYHPQTLAGLGPLAVEHTSIAPKMGPVLEYSVPLTASRHYLELRIGQLGACCCFGSRAHKSLGVFFRKIHTAGFCFFDGGCDSSQADLRC